MGKIKLLFLFILIISCSKKKSSCEIQPDPGYCEAYIPKYYFDQEEKKCKEFIWGGCNGVVPFETLKSCKVCE